MDFHTHNALELLFCPVREFVVAGSVLLTVRIVDLLDEGVRLEELLLAEFVFLDCLVSLVVFGDEVGELQEFGGDFCGGYAH